MKMLVIGMITLYQWLLSPFIGQSCRFYPSCSAYGKEAVERHGVFVGLKFTVGRILRCRPGAEAGVDPVPECLKHKEPHGA